MHSTIIEKSKSSLQEEAMSNMIKNMEAGSTNEAFDGSAEPIIYMSDNRMPVMIEFSSTIIYIIFAALVLALIFILPGIRRTKLTSFFGLITLLTVGASILLALEGSQWLAGSIQLTNTPYSSLTSELFDGKLEINVGLHSANVTLSGKLSSFEISNIQEDTVDYNERFYWDNPDKMAKEHLEALRKGLPYPILTVTEFLSQDSDGFNWTRQLRQAGFFSSLALYSALVAWCLMTVVMCVLPVYLPHMLQITGSLMMVSVWVYTLFIQSPKSFVFHIGGNTIEFAFGFTYVSTFVAGALSMFAGVLLYAIQISNPGEQLTIMDSEQYCKDRKVLGSLSLAANALANNKLQLIIDEKNLKEFKTVEPTNSVIIPIADIEENFKPTVNSKL